MMNEFDSKEASEAFAEEFNQGFSSIIRKIASQDSACAEDPAKTNDLKGVIKRDIQALMVHLNKTINGKPVDFQKFKAAIVRMSEKENCEDNTKALVFFMEIFVEMMETKKPC